MSGIKSGAIILSQSLSPVTPKISGDLSIYSRNSQLYVYDGTTENIIPNNTIVVNITSGLNSRVNVLETNYATKATPISGTYNTIVVNSQGIVVSGGNTNASVDLSSYTPLTTTNSVSGQLLAVTYAASANALNQANTSRIAGDLLLTPLVTTATISAGLHTRVNVLETNYATKATPISGTYNTIVVNSQGIVVSGGNVPVDLSLYTPLTTTNSLTGQLLSVTYASSANALNQANTLRIAGDLLLTPLATTALVTGQLVLTTTLTTTASNLITYSNATSANALAQAITNTTAQLSVFTPISTSNAISAGINSRLVTVETNFTFIKNNASVTYSISASAPITGGVDGDIVYVI